MKYFCLISCCLLSTTLFSQRTILGLVTDTSGQPLPFANIYEPNTQNGVVTNADGRFELTVKGSTIVASYVGFVSDTVVLTTDNYYAIALREAYPYPGSADDPYYFTITGQALHPTLSVTELIVPDLNPLTTLNQLPGVLAHSGTLNTNRITLRGVGNRSPFGTAKLRAYVDEIPITSGSGETSIEDIDLSIIDGLRAEAGPGLPDYGSALGGTILLSPFDNFSSDERGMTLAQSLTFGEYGLRRAVSKLQHKSAGTALRLHFHNTRSDGYRANNEYLREGLSMILRIRPDTSTTARQFTLFADHADVFAQIPSSLNETDFRENPSAAAPNWAAVSGFEDYDRTLVGASYRTPLGYQFSNTSSLFLRRRDNYESRPFNILREQSFAMGARTVFRKNLENIRLKLGGEFQHEEYDYQTNRTDGGHLDTLLSDNFERRSYYFAFAEASYWWRRVEILTGINLNQTDYFVRDDFPNDGIDRGGDFTYGSEWSPYFRIDYNLSNFRQQIRGIVSRGFSVPTLEETLLPSGRRNNDIRPETGWSYELQYTNRVTPLEIQLRAYRMDIRNLLVARRTAEDQFIGLNAGSTRHQGLEVVAEYERSFDRNTTLSLYGTYQFSHYRFRDFRVLENDYSGNELTGQPAHQFNLRSDFVFAKNFTWQTTFRFVRRQPLRDDNSIYGAGYGLLGSSIAYARAFGRWTLRCYTGVDNLLDTDYASMFLINASSFGGRAPRYYYPGLPRNFFGGFSLGVRF